MRKQYWLIPNILRTEPIDGEFKRLDQFDEDVLMRGHGDSCHILHYNNGTGDLVSPAYFGMIEIAKMFNLQRLSSCVERSNGSMIATVQVKNWKTGFSIFGASQSKIEDGKIADVIAEQKAYRNGIRLSIRPAVIRNYAENWIAEHTWQQYERLSNKDLACAIFDPHRPDATMEGRLEAIRSRFGFEYDSWQARYILLRILRLPGSRFKSADWLF